MDTTEESDSIGEQSEALKRCLTAFNENKISQANAWSVPVIDTMSILVNKHHQSLNNFKVAGSSLEASSRVYGLRVDSIYSDVVRMTAGLNARKLVEKDLVAEEPFEADQPAEGEAAGGDAAAPGEDAQAPKEKPAEPVKQKKARKPVSTVTKNRDTLNAPLQTVQFQDPVFGQLNTIGGSLGSVTRLMHNILLSADSELKLSCDFHLFDANELPQQNYMQEPTPAQLASLSTVSCDRLAQLRNLDNCLFRPLKSGYRIADTPMSRQSDADDAEDAADNMSVQSGGDNDDRFNVDDVCMAFDMNAEVEPMPSLTQQAPIMDVDYNDLDELTVEDQMAIHNCRALRKAPVLVEDLRPIDPDSELEYSYVPMQKISQFWAGPSHWKFRRGPQRLSQRQSNQYGGTQTQSQDQQPRAAGQRAKRSHALRDKQLNFSLVHDELFLRLDNKTKSRRTNMRSQKWDQRKNKLPHDYKYDYDMFNKFEFAAGIQPPLNLGQPVHYASPETVQDMGEDQQLTEHFGGDDDRNDADDIGLPDNTLMPADAAADAMGYNSQEDVANNTVLEIPTEYEGAPQQVRKIVVPFAKRAKVIDMKALKRTSSDIMKKCFHTSNPEDAEGLKHANEPNEQYEDGVASFNMIYKELPDKLPKSQAESISPSIALYSLLHLANEQNLRLFEQKDLADFKIRKIKTPPPPTQN